ncbi:DUF3472 domain-containing protein [Chitinibacter sp. GC72]|uniref:DUF3472 domain-containing protein n=1 Tax=Chitinibacter sp. GC72 TaxID=1526917 RepID=UPI0012FC8E1E|nr:DUF3472 domain-containing protein [Chitinibacter sp. GC72]
MRNFMIIASAAALSQLAHAATVTPWDSNQIYATPGQQVSHQGNVYQNKWWTRGENPTQSGQWGVWAKIGTVTPTSTPKPATSATPVAKPTATPLVTAKPTNKPTASPTAAPTLQPTATPKPTAVPTSTPIATAQPTAQPTAAPAPGQCANGSSITALTPSAGVARMGSVYSSTLYDPGNKTSGNDTHKPQQIKVQVSNAGQALAGCKVSWTPVNGNASGWVFPLADKTDANGQIAAWWTAGNASAQQIRASIQLADGSTRETEITGQAFPHSTRANSIHLNWSTPLWNAFSVDVTPQSWAPTTYYSAINFPGGYTGIQTSQLLFSLWDVNGISPVVIDKGMATCSTFGGEGTGIKCYAPYTPQVNVTYRFEVEVAATSDGKTDYTMYFTDSSNGQRKKFATMRYQAKVTPYGAAAFVEDWYEAKASCLANTRRAAYFSNVKYRSPSTGAWTEIRKASGTGVYNEWHNEICANYSFSTDQRRFLMGTGGEIVGQPLNLPNGPKSISLSLD